MATSDSTILKRCTKCRKEFPATLEYFVRDKQHKDRLTSTCKVCRRIARRRYRATHIEEERASSLRWRAEHIDQARANDRLYHKDHPEKHAAKERNRRAKLRAAEGTHTLADVEAQYKHQKGRCYYAACGHAKLGNTYHVDHVVPISRGGRNSPDNLVLTCPTCNHKKKDKLPHEFSEGGRLL